MWILLMEDEKRLAESLKRGLEEEGYTVETVHDGLTGEEKATINAFDLLIVDWRMPNQDGLTTIQNLRKSGYQTPILMLTALGDIDHRIQGLDSGADDYLPKPFVFEELLARVRALLRRRASSFSEPLLKLGDLQLDTSRHSVRYGDQPIFLRPKEYALLELLMRNAGMTFSRTVLAERVWGDAFSVSDNTLDVTVSGLRQKLATARDAAHPVVLETVRGVGFRLTDEASVSR